MGYLYLSLLRCHGPPGPPTGSAGYLYFADLNGKRDGLLVFGPFLMRCHGPSGPPTGSTPVRDAPPLPQLAPLSHSSFTGTTTGRRPSSTTSASPPHHLRSARLGDTGELLVPVHGGASQRPATVVPVRLRGGNAMVGAAAMRWRLYVADSGSGAVADSWSIGVGGGAARPSGTGRRGSRGGSGGADTLDGLGGLV